VAAKNEAKIRFTAETGEFNEGIKAANNQLSSLRAEMKLNDAQMKASGASVEALQAKHKNLENQLAAQQDKTQALSEKLKVAVDIFGENSDEATKLRNQLLASQTAEVKLQASIANCNAEIERQKQAQEKSKTAGESLNDTISAQQSELNDLKKRYVDAVLEFGAASDQANELAGKIDDLSGDLKQNKDRMQDAEKAANDLDNTLGDAGESAESAGDGFTIFKGALADLASNAIQAVIGKLGELIGYFAELPEATRELRQDMSTLATAFDEVGFSTETAKDTWRDLYAVFGEDDRAVEAANNISRMADSQKELDEWVRITTGVWGMYQDALPVEGLAEAAGETAKVGKVTGVLADALNWSSEAAVMFADYMSEDVTNAEDAFNVALSECSTEAERQALITDTLTALYGDAADTYRDTASAQIEAKEATADNILAEANLADAIEPTTTAWDQLKNKLLVGVLPAVESVTSVLTPMIQWLTEHPAALYAVGAAIGVVTVALGILAVATAVQTIANSALFASMVPLMLPILGIVAAVAALIAIIAVCVKYWGEIKAAAASAWDWVVEKWQAAASWFDTTVIQPIVGFFTGLWESIKNAFSAAWEWIKSTPIFQFYEALFTSIWNTVKSVIDVIVQLASGAWEIIKAVWSVVSGWFSANITQPIANFFSGMWNGVKDAANSAWNVMKDGASKAWGAIKSIFGSVASFFGDIFGSAWQRVKDVFSTGGAIFSGITEGITSMFKRVVNAIIGGVNRVVAIPFNKINSLLSTIRNTSVLGIAPFRGIGSISVPQIPLLAAGGILTQPTLNIAGEAGPEAVIPIDKLQSYISSAIDRTMQTANIQALVAAVENLADRAIELNINGKQFAVATASDSDVANGNRLVLQKRGLVV
jgi:hypothetical protein